MSDVTSDGPSIQPPAKIKRKNLLGKTFLKTYHIFCRVICMLTLIAQSALIDYYIVVYQSSLWGLWIVADLVVVGLFLAMFIISYRYLRLRHVIALPTSLRQFVGELPLTYISWFTYAVLLSAKVCVLYAQPSDKPVAQQLIESYFFGPNMLRTAISLSSIIIYLVVLTSHDTRSRSPQSEFITAIVGSVYIDVLDTTQFLGSLREENHIIAKNGLRQIILGVIVFNFIIPTEALIVLSKKHFGKTKVSLRNQMLHRICYFIVVNLPIFVIRMLIWHLHDQNVSVFLVKNLLGIGLAIKDIHEFTLDLTEVIKDELHLDDKNDIDGHEATSCKDKKQHMESVNEKTVFKETDEFKAGVDT